MDISALDIINDIAYVMAKHANGSIESQEIWLEQFTMFGIPNHAEEIISLWSENVETHVQSKKNAVAPKES